ncbi:MAG: hypothetical protein EOO78_00565 [Oxalobacteraceae bacterium]|nr:MAG: hypothetical protein EOO78_00565 [Oxalobacteraceae bacterium]
MNRHRPPREQLQHIPGWGSDLDHKNRPAIPMERMPPRFIHVPQGQPVQQAQTVEVFCSPERPGITPIFGTAQPPKWVSGAIRRLAYKLPENDVRHWLMLIAADRVNVVEGIVDDLRHGHVPNVLGEMGIRAELRHNPAGLVRKALVTAVVVGGVMALLKRRDRY